MKKLNKKGFTLIELLAVIVILGILMMTAIPAVTRAIAKSRRNTYWQNMKSYAKSAATPFLDGEYSKAGATDESCPYPGKGEYVIIKVNQVELEQGDIKKSSFKSEYKDGDCAPTIIVANLGNPSDDSSKDNLQWYVAGVDKAGNGINVFTNINNLSLKSVKTGLGSTSCAATVGSGNSLKVSGTDNENLVAATSSDTNKIVFKANCVK